jgi:SAM domain (Sterile alpha motif)
MSFPLTGKVADVAEWLRTKDFTELTIENFAKWDAEDMLSVTDIDLLLRIVPGNEGIRLWALLNTARNLQGEFR